MYLFLRCNANWCSISITYLLFIFILGLPISYTRIQQIEKAIRKISVQSSVAICALKSFSIRTKKRLLCATSPACEYINDAILSVLIIFTTLIIEAYLHNSCLSKFVVSNRGRYGSVNDDAGAYFDHEQLHRVTKIVTRNLDKVIDVNQYPIDGAKKSNRNHRPIGIGVSGLADAFLRLGLPFASEDAKALNEAIFETIYHAALEASNEIAKEKGSYGSFAGSPASEGTLQFDLWGISDSETPSHRYGKDPSKLRLLKYSKRVHGEGYDWQTLRQKIMKGGLRNSLLVAPMPTASTSQILGVNECFEPFASNLYVRRVKAGEFIIVNPHLIQDLTDLGLWNQSTRNQLMRDGGYVAKIACVPDRLKNLYKTVWEMKMKDIIDMAADRGKFIDQSQSLNLFIADPNVDRLTAMHFYAWKKGLKTGIYYLRTKPAVNAIQYTVSKMEDESSVEGDDSIPVMVEEHEACLGCSA